jgi:spore germination protein GerM
MIERGRSQGGRIMTRTVRILALLVASVLISGCGPTASPSIASSGSVAASGASIPVASNPVAESPRPSPVEPTTSPSSGEPTPSPGAPPTASPSATASTMIVRAYFLLASAAGGDPRLVPVLRTVPGTVAAATSAMEQLLAGPSVLERGASPGVSSLIPAETRLIGVRIVAGIATVNLSSDYASGGGSSSIRGRLAQVVYTLTQFASVSSVRFELDGQPVTVFSSEGILLDKPVGRSAYRDLLPSIFVDRPAYRAALGNPGPVSGLANVFEATFRVAVIDAAGRTLVARQVTASCGTGCWGTFGVTVPYSVAAAQWGSLRAWAVSARDGSVQDLRAYPVWLTPAP